MDLFKAIFGRAAEDIQHYSRAGFPYALCLDHPDALNVAIETAEGRHQLDRSQLVYSVPYPEHECPGYLVLKDEFAARDIQREVVLSGLECTLAHNGKIVPWLGL